MYKSCDVIGVIKIKNEEETHSPNRQDENAYDMLVREKLVQNKLENLDVVGWMKFKSVLKIHRMRFLHYIHLTQVKDD